MLELLLWAFSAVALSSVSLQLVDAALYQERASVQLAARDQPTDVGAGPAHPGASEPTVGTPLARLEIPRLDISAVVAEGDGEETLRRAIGHVPGTALPGETGNTALAAHRDTFFRHLGDIAPDDLVVLERGGQRHRYRVAWTDVVEPSQTEVTAATPRPSLTLITCYPFRWIGPAPKRFVVRAHLESTRHPPTPQEPEATRGRPTGSASSRGPWGRSADPTAGRSSAPR